MARNFLRCLAEWEKAYITRPVNPATELQKTVVNRLKNYVTECSFSDSKITKFFCRYYDKTYSQLVTLWKTEFGTVKTEDTIRGQVGAISRQLVDIFGSFETIDTALKMSNKYAEKVTDDERREAEKILKDVLLRIDGLEQVDEVTGIVPFAVDIERLANLSATSNTYKLSECQAELKLLKALSVRSIQNLFDDIDLGKLSYLLRVLNEPLMLTEAREYEKDGKVKPVSKKSLNVNKIKLLEEFEVVTATKLRAPKISKVKEEVASLNEVSEIADDFKPDTNESGVESREALPFNFDTMSELCEVIQEKQQGDYKITINSEQRAKNIEYLKKVFDLFTVQGLKEYLTKFADGDVAQAIEKYRKD